jgi:hypothetical protein
MVTLARACTLFRSNVTLQSMQVKWVLRQLDMCGPSLGFFNVSPQPSHWNQTISFEAWQRAN